MPSSNHNMKAMLLAAGRGMRMRPLTDTTPKVLLEVNGEPLIVRQIKLCAAAGIQDIVINLSYLGEQIQNRLGDGTEWGVKISYTVEQPEGLETGGGIFNALELLGDKPFLVMSGDIYTDYPLSRLIDKQYDLNDGDLVHGVMVPNPSYHLDGDFVLYNDRLRVPTIGEECVTYGNIAVIHPKLFANCKPGRFPLAPLLHQAMRVNLASGELFAGLWANVGTPADLQALNNELA